MREIIFCSLCGYSTNNKKSFSNHIRYGCKSQSFTSDLCKHCHKELPKRKPSEKGLFCNRVCYTNWKKESGSSRGINSPRYLTGESRTRLYTTWLGMKRRCTKENCKDYINYGGRGIKVCDSWMNDFLQFKDWAFKNGYTDELTIERINVNGDYDPSNCKWIKIEEQAKNRRNARNKIFI